MDKILLIGAGGHAKTIVDTIERNGQYHIEGFVDIGNPGCVIYKDYKVIGNDEELKSLYDNGITNAVIAIGYMGKSDTRICLYEKLKAIGFTLPVIVDDSAVIAGDVVIGEGTYVGKNAVINSAATIGKMCIINTSSIVEHDCIVKAFSHVAVGATLCGGVEVGQGCLVGANATILQGREIGKNSIVGAGAIITKNVEDNVVVRSNLGYTDRKRTLIIAEAGVNHNGNIDLAYKMIDEAKKAGADIIKFQTAKAENMISKYAQKAEYQKRQTGENESQLDMVKKLMLQYSDYKELKKYCDNIGIKFLSTPFDIESIQYLDELVDIWKVPSGEITNYPYLVEIAKTGKEIIMSTGMSTLEEIREAIEVIKENGGNKISLLHCNTQYPTPYEDVNLAAMVTLEREFNVPVGYSDHTLGIEIPIAAAAMGASIIEKHFTLDRNMDGPDHKASLEPVELKNMVKAIRNIELAIGDGIKKVTASENANRDIARKSIVAKRNIKKGEVLSEDNITTKRPGNGISPIRWNAVLGSVAIRDFEEDELIEL